MCSVSDLVSALLDSAPAGGETFRALSGSVTPCEKGVVALALIVRGGSASPRRSGDEVRKPATGNMDTSSRTSALDARSERAGGGADYS